MVFATRLSMDIAAILAQNWVCRRSGMHTSCCDKMLDDAHHKRQVGNLVGVYSKTLNDSRGSSVMNIG